MDPLIDSLKRLIEQATQALGPEDPATLTLQQQLAALLAGREKPRNVFWLQQVDAKPEPDSDKSDDESIDRR